MEKFSLLTDLLSNDEKKLLEDMLQTYHVPVKSQTFKGRNIIPVFNASCMEYVYDEWNIKRSDVFVASYPKTVNKFSILDKMPLPRRVFHTHLTPSLININKIEKAGAKVVYVYRNPKDQMVSWLKFLQNIPMGSFEPFKTMIESGWDEYVNHILAGNFYMNLKPGEWYPDHILSWYSHRNDKTVYFVAYEDLKTDLFREVKKVADFLENPIGDKTASSIVAATTIQSMKQTNEKKGYQQKNFLRNGEVGGWKNYFTVNQSERIDAIMKEKLKDTDIRIVDELK